MYLFLCLFLYLSVYLFAWDRGNYQGIQAYKSYVTDFSSVY